MLPSSSTDLAYFAGILDGEGSVVINKQTKGAYSPTYRLRIEIGNTDKPLIDWLLDRFGGVVHPSRSGYGGGRWRRMYYWEMTQPDSWAVLEAVLPYLIIKRERAEVGLSFLRDCRFEIRTGGKRGFWRVPKEELALREGYYLAMKTLNRRGPLPQI